LPAEYNAPDSTAAVTEDFKEESDMNGLFRRDAFTGFGPHGLATGQEATLLLTRAKRGGHLRHAVRRDCPRLPGVYGMIDAAGELIYVGKAKSLRSRLLGYFRPSRDEKAARIVREARGLTWESAANEFGALLRELELIRRHQPRFNVIGQPRRHRRCYICIGRRPAPYAYLATKAPTAALAVFGPVPGMRRTREAVRRLNDWFRLRDCPQKQTMVFAGQAELFPLVRAPGCIRHEIGHCLAPCAANCTRRDYAFHVEAALDFLNGRDRSPLEILEREMNAASVALQFERAAILRDRLDSLTWLARHLERLRHAVRQSFVYPVAGIDGGETWYLIRHGLVRAAVNAPVDRPGRSWARRQMEEVYRSERAVTELPAADEIDGVLLVAAWFRRHHEERERVIEVEEALARVGA
jgi:excinuclease ABC subunit C